MEITKELKIIEVKATNISNAPFQITLNNSIDKENNTVLVFNKETYAKYKIPMEFDLVGKVFTCSFVSRETKEKFSSDRYSLEIQSIEKKEITSLLPQAILVRRIEKISRKLILSTHGGYGRFADKQCPFYKFILCLTEKEYFLCKNLSPETEFELKNLSVNDA